MSAATIEQPPPKATDRTPAWDLVIADARWFGGPALTLIPDMEARDKLGRERYGVPLTSGNGRNALVDAYQELLDAAVYLRAWLDERGWTWAKWIEDDCAWARTTTGVRLSPIVRIYLDTTTALTHLKQEVG